MSKENPYGARVPLNLTQNRDEVLKAFNGEGSPTWRDPIAHPYTYRKPQDEAMTADRSVGNPIARRYPNGVLDVEDLMHRVVDVMHKIKDQEEALSEPEMALLALAMPQLKTQMTEDIAKIYIRLSDDELSLLKIKLAKFLATEQNWQAGRGGGTVPGSDTTRGGN